jgi:D-glycero-D-manno-heptose 1,7-bisphosphate phosphatase
MTKLLILDKDGTLVKPKSGSSFVQHPEDQELLPGVAEAIARYAVDGWQMAIVSNQGGVEAGHKTLESAIVEMQYCLFSLLCDVCKTPINAYFCPDKGSSCYMVEFGGAKRVDHLFPGQNFRKPGIGMIWLATYRVNKLFPEQVRALFVSDRPEDEGAAKAANVPFMWAKDWRENIV